MLRYGAARGAGTPSAMGCPIVLTATASLCRRAMTCWRMRMCHPHRKMVKGPDRCFSPPLCVQYHWRGDAVLSSVLVSQGRAPAALEAPGLGECWHSGIAPGWVRHEQDGDSWVAMGTLGHVAGDDWSLGCESLQWDRWQCGTRYPVGHSVPRRGCAGGCSTWVSSSSSKAVGAGRVMLLQSLHGMQLELLPGCQVRKCL